MDKAKLRYYMAKNDDVYTTLSKKIGISYQRFTAKINETKGAEFTQTEIQKIKDLYSLSADETTSIFFN